MDVKPIVIVLACTGMLAAVSGCIGSNQQRGMETVTLTSPIQSGYVVDIQNTDGDVTIIASNTSLVSVVANKTSSAGKDDLKNINVSIHPTGNRLTIQTTLTGFSLSQRSVDYIITVPFNTTVGTITTRDGAVMVSNVSGDVTVTSTKNQIIMRDIKGYVDATTTNSRIEVIRSAGIKKLETTNSGITADVSNITAITRITTTNSAIALRIRPTLNVILDLQTTDSGIQTSGLSINITTSQEHHLVGTLGAGGSQLIVRTTNSRITVEPLLSS
jgi:hypothetical protein